MTESELKDQVTFITKLIADTWDTSIDWKWRQFCLLQSVGLCRDLAIKVAEVGDETK